MEKEDFEQQMKIITPKMINVDSIIGIKSFSGKVIVADLENEYFINNANYFNNVGNFLIYNQI